MSNNLIEQIAAKRSELVTKRFQLKSGQLTKTHEVREARRAVARLFTQLNKAGK